MPDCYAKYRETEPMISDTPLLHREPETRQSNRLHLSDGPINLVINAWGRPEAVEHAYGAAAKRFETILMELVEELPKLRMRVSDLSGFKGQVAKRMYTATEPYKEFFITPMAAVAGSVADEILSVLRSSADLDKIYVNNGGDIALWVGEHETLSIGVISDLAAAYSSQDHPGPRPGPETSLTIGSDDGVGGVATSGWAGRSLSLGIADAVTVLAANAAQADAAATMIANAVNVESDHVIRQPAHMLDPDSDLGSKPITVEVGELNPREIQTALGAGLNSAGNLLKQGLIAACAIALADRVETVHNLSSKPILSALETI